MVYAVLRLRFPAIWSLRSVIMLLLILPASGAFGQKEDEFTDKSGDDLILEDPNFIARKLDTSENVYTIAFGSCNKLAMPQDMWASVLASKPDLWVWLGDIIYSDTENMRLMSRQYRRLKWSPGYRKVRASCQVIGVWDDHDYGQNDGDKTFPKRKESRELLFNFLDVPKNSEFRKREGAYQSYTFGEGNNRIKVILLDTRYFRDELKPDPTKKARYIRNTSGDMLGEAQWKWLEKELKSSDAGLNIICSSVQILSDQHRFEKWGNFPGARKRLFNTILKSKARNVLMLSGDRHMAEFSKMNIEGLPYPLYDFTASGLTHTRPNDPEENKFREKKMIVRRNFGVLRVAWNKGKPIVRMQVMGLNNQLLDEVVVHYPE